MIPIVIRNNMEGNEPLTQFMLDSISSVYQPDGLYQFFTHNYYKDVLTSINKKISDYTQTNYLKSISCMKTTDSNISTCIKLELTIAPIYNTMTNHIHTIRKKDIEMINKNYGKGNIMIDTIVGQIRSYNDYIKSVIDDTRSKTTIYEYIKYVKKNVATCDINGIKYHYIVSMITDSDIVIYKGKCHGNCIVCKHDIDVNIIALTDDIHRLILNDNVEILI